MPRVLKTILAILAALIGVGILFCTAVVARIYYRFSPFEYTTATSVPTHRVGIVFGAQVVGTKLSPILQDRVNAAIELYNDHVISKILMTGDNSELDYNEVVAMQKYALNLGIPAADMTLDYAGFDTFDSCYRAHTIFGVNDAVLITQQYHMPRALYLCRTLGIDAVGYAIPDFSKYPDLRTKYTVREWGADLKAWWQLHTGATPKFLGDPVPIK